MLKLLIPCLLLLFSCTPPNNSNQNNQQQKQRNNFVPISTKKVVSQVEVPDTKIDFELLGGRHWFLDSNIIIYADRGDNLIDVRMRFELPDSIEVPKVYSTSFHEYHEADNLEVKVELMDSLLSKSKLTDSDVDVISKQIKRGIAKRHDNHSRHK